MAKGFYCVRHDQFFGNVLPCKYCQEEAKQAREAEQYQVVSYEEWRATHQPTSSQGQP